MLDGWVKQSRLFGMKLHPEYMGIFLVGDGFNDPFIHGSGGHLPSFAQGLNGLVM
jgi:hypothetical protein